MTSTSRRLTASIRFPYAVDCGLVGSELLRPCWLITLDPVQLSFVQHVVGTADAEIALRVRLLVDTERRTRRPQPLPRSCFRSCGATTSLRWRGTRIPC